MEDTPKNNHVVVVGAGIAGLVSTVTLAEEYLRKQQQDHSSEDRRSQSGRVPLTISLLEAHPFVGGRIRTAVTDNEYDSEGQQLSPILFHGDRLPDSQRVDGFAPWPVPIGAEFVHGVDSMANRLIEDHEEWLVIETFNLCASTEDYPSDNSFVQRRNSLSLSAEQTSAPHIRVFMNGQCFPLQEDPGHQYKIASDEEAEPSRGISRLIRKTNQIWQALQNIGEEVDCTNDVCGSVTHKRDMSLDEFVEDQMSQEDDGFTPDETETVKQILESLYSNTAGTSNKSLGVHEASREDWNWEYTESNFRSEQCFQEFVKYYIDRISEINKQAESSRSGIQINIEVGCPVTEIGSVDRNEVSTDETKVQRSPIRVVTRTGKTLVCDRCIVTVPLGVLKANKIAFRDAYRIPHEMQEAIDTINMFSGMKGHMLLRVGADIEGISYFLKHTELLFCPGEIFSQIWLRRDENTVFLTGFCVANCRDRLMEMVANANRSAGGEGTTKSATARELMLGQVHRMFGTRYGGDTVFLEPTSPTCSFFVLHDWSDDEFALGIYSSPSVGAGWVNKNKKKGESATATGETDSVLPPTHTHRDYLAKPIRNEIWLAGEHANKKTCATVQAAMESGAETAKEVYQSLKSAY